MLAGAGMSIAPMAWTPGYAVLVFLMWWIMMVAMMLPSASPVILLFANVSRRQQALGKLFVPAFFFLAGYVVVWGLFSLIATGAQWGLQASGRFSMMTGSDSHLLSAAILIAGMGLLAPRKRERRRNWNSLRRLDDSREANWPMQL